MKSSLLPTASGAVAPDSEPQPLRRRGVVIGAGVAAGAALVATALPGKREAQEQAAEAPSARRPAEGYRLTDHIRRYYETTRS